MEIMIVMVVLMMMIIVDSFHARSDFKNTIWMNLYISILVQSEWI